MNVQSKPSTKEWLVAGTIVVAVFCAAIGGLMAGLPLYNVWKKEQSGKAALSEAQHSKLVQIEEAKANLESEKLNALAEVERAKGAAKAIAIEGGRLTDEYIKYLWVRQQKPGAGQVIYVPTEAGLPILEAGQR